MSPLTLVFHGETGDLQALVSLQLLGCTTCLSHGAGFVLAPDDSRPELKICKGNECITTTWKCQNILQLPQLPWKSLLVLSPRPLSNLPKNLLQCYCISSLGIISKANLLFTVLSIMTIDLFWNCLFRPFHLAMSKWSLDFLYPRFG